MSASLGDMSLLGTSHTIGPIRSTQRGYAMSWQGLGVPEVDTGQEVDLLARGELLEHFFDIDVGHLVDVIAVRSTGCIWRGDADSLYSRRG